MKWSIFQACVGDPVTADMMMWRLPNHPVFYKFCKFSYKIDVSEETSKRWMDHQEAENHRSCEVTRSRLFDLLQVLVAYAPNWDTLLAKRPNLYLIANPSERSRGIRVCQGSCFKVLEGKNRSWWVLEAGQSGALLKSWVLEGNFFMVDPFGYSETQWAGRRWAMGR